MAEIYAVRGDICFTPEFGRISSINDGYIVCSEGRIEGVFTELPEKYRGMEIKDFRGKIICPGMSDLHIHAPQYVYRGLGMDLELLQWLEQITFPQEARFADLDYARRAYDMFAEDIRKSATTRVNVFATIHTPATVYLMEALDRAGLAGYVGKVNMDRNSPDNYREKTEESIRATIEWLGDVSGRFDRIKPMITPRFVPSCTDELMAELGRIAGERKLPVQSHLSENISEVEWVRELAPDSKGYADAYDRFGLFGQSGPAVMAHCLYLTGDEMKLMKERGVYVAHSPQSNVNLCSGIAPMRVLINEGIRCGLASDVAGGSSINLFKAVTDAVQVSKLRWRLVDSSCAPITFPEALWMATAGGGSFFGKIGLFAEGYEFDALVIDDSSVPTPLELNIEQRLERMMYLGHTDNIVAKFVAGKRIK